MTATASVLVCRGCCWGTDDEYQAARHLETLRAAALGLPKGRLTVTNCLGPCSERDIVAIRHRDTDRPGRPLAATWFRLVDEAAVEHLGDWVAAGATGPTPESLRANQFDPDDHGVTPDDEITTSDRAR